MRILTCGIKELLKEKYKPIDMKETFFINKPRFGLYGSTYLPNEKYKSDWLRWVVSENFHINEYQNAISYKLHKSAKICEVDNFEDYLKLLSNYSLTEYQFYGMWDNIKRYIDWNRLSKNYDAFHLTESAFWELRCLFDKKCANFYSYDCETWIIMNFDCINLGSIQNHNFNYKGEEYDE